MLLNNNKPSSLITNVLLRIRLSSTLQRRKPSPKTDSFENVFQSGAIWKRCFLKKLFSSVDGENDAIWKRWRHPNRHDRAPAHSTVRVQNCGQTVPCGFSLDWNDFQSFDALASAFNQQQQRIENGANFPGRYLRNGERAARGYRVIYARGRLLSTKEA